MAGFRTLFSSTLLWAPWVLALALLLAAGKWMDHDQLVKWGGWVLALVLAVLHWKTEICSAAVKLANAAGLTDNVTLPACVESKNRLPARGCAFGREEILKLRAGILDDEVFLAHPMVKKGMSAIKYCKSKAKEALLNPNVAWVGFRCNDPDSTVFTDDLISWGLAPHEEGDEPAVFVNGRSTEWEVQPLCLNDEAYGGTFVAKESWNDEQKHTDAGSTPHFFSWNCESHFKTKQKDTMQMVFRRYQTACVATQLNSDHVEKDTKGWALCLYIVHAGMMECSTLRVLMNLNNGDLCFKTMSKETVRWGAVQLREKFARSKTDSFSKGSLSSMQLPEVPQTKTKKARKGAMDTLAHESLKPLGAITGVMNAEDMNILEAAKRTEIEDIAGPGQLAMDAGEGVAAEDEHKLTRDEAGSFHLYSQETDFCYVMNSACRAEDRSQLKAFFPSMKLMLQGYKKLPKYEGTGYRGIKGDDKRYKKGAIVWWWSWSSVSKDIETLQSDDFLGTVGERTLFTIQMKNAVDISSYSAYPEEAEVLLPPGTRMRVTGNLEQGNGLRQVTLVEEPPEAPVLS